MLHQHKKLWFSRVAFSIWGSGCGPPFTQFFFLLPEFDTWPISRPAYLKTNVLIVTNEFELLGLLCRPARGGRALAVLDASVVNVYQGANAVIFMVDPYRPQTLDKVSTNRSVVCNVRGGLGAVSDAI